MSLHLLFTILDFTLAIWRMIFLSNLLVLLKMKPFFSSRWAALVFVGWWLIYSIITNSGSFSFSSSYFLQLLTRSRFIFINSLCYGSICCSCIHYCGYRLSNAGLFHYHINLGDFCTNKRLKNHIWSDANWFYMRHWHLLHVALGHVYLRFSINSSFYCVSTRSKWNIWRFWQRSIPFRSL